MPKPFYEEQLAEFYHERLGGISTNKELQDALARGEIDLKLDLDQIVSPEQRQEILKNNPDEIIIGEAKYPIEYEHDEWTDQFSAKVEIPVSEIFKIKEIPCLPSGRELIIKVTADNLQYVAPIVGHNLENLQKQARERLLDGQWETFKRRRMALSLRKEVVSFDPHSDTLPPLPEPIEYGTDPATQEPALAYPAVVVEKSVFGPKFYIQYYPDEARAQEEQAQTLAFIEKIKTKKQDEDEQIKTRGEGDETRARVDSLYKLIGNEYLDYGLSELEIQRVTHQLIRGQFAILLNEKDALKQLQQTEQRLRQAVSYKEQRDAAQVKIKEAKGKYYAKCPLCGDVLVDGACTNQKHDAGRIVFEIDKDGKISQPVILSQLATEREKIVLQMRCSAGTKKYNRGDIYLYSGPAIPDQDKWKGESFTELKYKDFGKILSPEEAREKEEKVKSEIGDPELIHALEQVKKGSWGRNSFVLGKHPKTGENRWGLVIEEGGLTIQYVVDPNGPQPLSPDFDYFWRPKKTLVDSKNHKIISVVLEPPFPAQ